MSDVSIKLTLGSFSLEVSGSEEYVNRKFEELVGRYLSGPKPLIGETRLTPQAPLATDATGKKLSAAEFLKKAGPKNQSELAMLLGYYLEKMQDFPAFTSSELTALARESKRTFANVSDSVAKLTGRGYMMSAGDRDGQRGYVVTASGEEYVESMLEAHGA
jgi:hypothetical protein